MLAAALGVALGLWWYTGGRHHFVPRAFYAVEGGIYRSGQLSRFLTERTLRNHGIGLVIFMSNDKANRPDVQAEQEVTRRMGIERINCPLDGKGIGDVRQYVRALVALHRAQVKGVPALVHCHTGAQRTGGVIAFWNALVRGQSGRDIHRELLRHGHDPARNPDLVPYLNQHMQTVAEALVSEGVIAAVPHPLPRIEP